MASSTTKPVAMVKAISVRLLRLYPSKNIAPQVPSKEIGTARLAMMVARTLRRNSKITSTTSDTATNSSMVTCSMEARIVPVRSDSTVTFTEAGRLSVSSGSRCCIASTVWMTFAPGCRCTFKIIAGFKSAQAPSRTFSCACTTRATSDKRTGAPFFQATIRLA